MRGSLRSKPTSIVLALLAVAVAVAPVARGQDRGRLSITSSPLGEIVIDGRPTGANTPRTDLEVVAGEHEVAVRFPRSGRTSPAQRLVVRAGRTTFAHFYDRPAAEDLDDACERGEEQACWFIGANAFEAGEMPRAIAGLEAYLRDFPGGVYADAARAMLPTAHRMARGEAPEPEARSPYAGWLAVAALALAIAWFVRRRWRA